MKSVPLSIPLMLCFALSVNALTLAASVETKLTAPDAQRGDEFGRAVAVQGNVAVVGAPDESSAGSRAGAAYVFEKTTTGWQLNQKLTAHDASAASFFGASVAIDGDRIVVGATVIRMWPSVPAPLTCSLVLELGGLLKQS